MVADALRMSRELDELYDLLESLDGSGDSAGDVSDELIAVERALDEERNQLPEGVGIWS